MPDISIAISAQDRYSSAIEKMSYTTRAFNKDAEHMEQLLHDLTTQKVDIKLELDEARAQLKTLEKQFANTKDEADGLQLQMAQANYDNIKRNYDLVTKGAREAENQMQKTGDAFRKTGNIASGASSGFKSIVGSLAAAGAGSILADLLGETAITLAGSIGGQATGTLLSSVLSMASSGAAVGSMILGPGAGTAAGAAVGGILGSISGAAKNFEEKDDAFKSYVQERFNEVTEEQASDLASGSSIASGREQKQLAFSTLLGSDAAAEGFLDEVKKMAADTNYTYDEITGYAKSLIKPFGQEKTFDVLTTLSDTSAALSLNSSDNSMLIAGLSRMKLTDKTTQEYLNYFSERGIDVYAALAKWGDAATVAEKVTKGKIRGSEAVEEILSYMNDQYGGLSVKMAETYEGMMGNLADAEANVQEAYGIGYNEKRKEGIQAQMDWLSGGEGEGLMDDYSAIGAWKAELENEKERYQREAIEAMKQTLEYQEAEAKGDAAKMGELLMRAKVQGMNEYNASEGAQLLLESELSLAGAIREDTESNQAYWDAGYRKGQEFSKGLLAGRLGGSMDPLTGNRYYNGGETVTDEWGNLLSIQGKAFGLTRVPRDNFPALLHQGERVLTASQAREDDQESRSVIVDKLADTLVVREEADINKIATALARELSRSSALALPV